MKKKAFFNLLTHKNRRRMEKPAKSLSFRSNFVATQQRKRDFLCIRCSKILRIRKIVVSLQHEIIMYKDMSIEEKRKRRDANRAINSKKTAITPFMKFARKYKGAFVINSPKLRAQLINCDD